MDDERKACGNCMYHVHDKVTDWICGNERSLDFADKTSFSHTCGEYVEKEGVKHYEWRRKADRRTLGQGDL